MTSTSSSIDVILLISLLQFFGQNVASKNGLGSLIGWLISVIPNGNLCVLGIYWMSLFSRLSTLPCLLSSTRFFGVFYGSCSTLAWLPYSKKSFQLVSVECAITFARQPK